MTPGDRDAYPTSDTFSTGDDFTFSPDSNYLVFTAVPETERGVEHELRHLPRAGHRRQGGVPDEGEQGGRQRAELLARRQEAGLPGAESGPASRRTTGRSWSCPATRAASGSAGR